MASLSAQQKEQVASWVNAGRSLSDIQKEISAEFGVSMTYMDVRFLVDDLDLTLHNKVEPTPPEPEAPAEAPGSPVPPAAAAPAEAPAPGASSLSLTIDPVQRPSVLVGGSVTFSDGATGQWQMDMQGQLGFVPPYPGYKPVAADVRAFQETLDLELRKLGY